MWSFTAQSTLLESCPVCHFSGAGLVFYAANQYFVHALLQVTDACASNKRKGENDYQNYFRIDLHKSYVTKLGFLLVKRPLDLQLDALPTELCYLLHKKSLFCTHARKAKHLPITYIYSMHVYIQTSVHTCIHACTHTVHRFSQLFIVLYTPQPFCNAIAKAKAKTELAK